MYIYVLTTHIGEGDQLYQSTKSNACFIQKHPYREIMFNQLSV